MPATTVIAEAIKFEEEGVALYQDMLSRSKTDLAKKLFSSLVQQEQSHIEYINKYSSSKKFNPMDYTPLENSIKQVFEDMRKEGRARGDMDNIKGYEFALKLEDKGFHMYQKDLGSATDPEDKKFFKFLMDMEKEHYEALANVFYYLTENEKWLALNESQTWSWMSL